MIIYQGREYSFSNCPNVEMNYVQFVGVAATIKVMGVSERRRGGTHPWTPSVSLFQDIDLSCNRPVWIHDGMIIKGNDGLNQNEKERKALTSDKFLTLCKKHKVTLPEFLGSTPNNSFIAETFLPDLQYVHLDKPPKGHDAFRRFKDFCYDILNWYDFHSGNYKWDPHSEQYAIVDTGCIHLERIRARSVLQIDA